MKPEIEIEKITLSEQQEAEIKSIKKGMSVPKQNLLKIPQENMHMNTLQEQDHSQKNNKKTVEPHEKSV
jgi:hypothetical protein